MVKNINPEFGDPVEFGSIEEMAAAIRACGYTLPEDGLRINRDYTISTEQVMYADTVNGIFDMTWHAVMKQVEENPFFSDPDDVCIIGTDGTQYTGNDLLEILGIKNEEM
jgi:hypothetical protein